MRIRWTFIQDGSILSNVDDIDKDHIDFSVELLPSSEIFAIPTPSFALHCRVYRALGAEITDLFNDGMGFRVYDCFDRSHPYVAWRHTVFPPWVKVSHSGFRFKGAETHRVDRVSRIHRIAIPGRCEMACNYSQKVSPIEKYPVCPDPHLVYLDELPFPVSELAAFRGKHVICDYCFFGGPTKTDPLI